MRPASRANNLVNRTGERWRPPLFAPPNRGRVAALKSSLRRFLDLPAASIWRTLHADLSQVHGSVLDVGCGAQPYRELFPADAAYLGLDSAGAKAKFGYDLPDTLYFDGDIWPCEKASASFILCTETLEHVLHPDKFLAEAFRSLRAGGRVLLTIPFAARWHFIPYDYWRFTPSSLSHLLTHAGFEDVWVSARGNAVTVACYKLQSLFVPLLFPSRKGFARLVTQLLGLTFAPLIVLLAVIGNASFCFDAGDDCLGYTAYATKPAPPK